MTVDEKIKVAQKLKSNAVLMGRLESAVKFREIEIKERQIKLANRKSRPIFKYKSLKTNDPPENVTPIN